MFGASSPAVSTGGGMNLYPDLPSELRTQTTANAPSQQLQQQQQQQQQGSQTSTATTTTTTTTNNSSLAPARGTTDNLGPVQRAARSIQETLEAEKRYPQLDDIVSQGQSQDYELAPAHAWEPFVRVNSYTIPDVIFEQYNRVTSYTLMGLFPEIKQAWVTVDNRLYMWDYATQTGFMGYEQQTNTITAVRMLKPKPGVFENVNYILVVATMVDVFLLGVNATQNQRGIFDVTLFETGMSIPTKGINVTIIEGSKKTGRIFLAGHTDNEVYEFSYQAEERWFQGRCQKICHTTSSASAFAPRLPAWASGPKDTENVKQMVVDDTRNLLYTLSSKSTIRVFHLRGDGALVQSLSHSFSHTLANIRVMVGNTPLLGPETPIVSISPVSALQARRTHLIAVTKSGCRLFMSAVSSEYGFGGTDSAPTSMQVIHIRYPPNGLVHNDVRKAKVFTPGYFFCFMERNPTLDELLFAAPDSAKIQALADGGNIRLQLAEQASTADLGSRVESIELVAGPFAAQRSPPGFGNELATQYDVTPTEIAILTNSGVTVHRRRRLVEVFDGLLRYGSAASTIGVEGEVRKFFNDYGRAEGCASALAVACGASQDSTASQTASRISDMEIEDLARRYFIEFGGKPRADNVFEASGVPSLDSIKVSGRAEGLQLYLARIVRSIWKAFIISESRTPGGGLEYVSSVPMAKLRLIQDQLVRLDHFVRTNKSFIVGLSGADSLLVAGSKIDEVANQAEHRMLHALVTLNQSMIEGISFVLFLLEDKLTDIILSLDTASRELVGTMTYGGLFATPQGQNLAKELVTAIVNRNIAHGVNVDTIADALRRRCGSFCSADDVVVFRALEQVKRAKTEKDADVKHRLLRESLRLFEETAASLTMDNLSDMVQQFRELQYHPGAVQLALVVAKEADRGNITLQFLTEPPTVENETSEIYHKRVQCYGFIFAILEDLDRLSTQSPEMIDGAPSPIMRLRNETWTLIYNSDDELFHYHLYDWLYSQGGAYAERLLDINSPYVLGYLTYRGAESLDHCELLWQYHSRRERFFEAAEVLHELAISEFQLTLEKRLEFFSRARNFCNSSYSGASRRKMNELGQTIQEELDVAVIQDDLLKRLREDPRISTEKKFKLEAKLGKGIIDLSKLFNEYASPYAYHDICLAIFQVAEYRGSADIKKCWEMLISQKHTQALEQGEAQPFEVVAETVRSMGSRFASSEYIFPAGDLIPLLERYAFEHQRDVGPDGWVVDTFIEAGVAEERILHVLVDMFYRDEVPFRGLAKRRILVDTVNLVERWWSKVIKRGGSSSEGFRGQTVSEALRRMMTQLPTVGPEADRVDRVLADIARRGY